MWQRNLASVIVVTLSWLSETMKFVLLRKCSLAFLIIVTEKRARKKNLAFLHSLLIITWIPLQASFSAFHCLSPLQSLHSYRSANYLHSKTNTLWASPEKRVNLLFFVISKLKYAGYKHYKVQTPAACPRVQGTRLEIPRSGVRVPLWSLSCTELFLSRP